MSNIPNHLIIFTRYPLPGKTKTRMIPALGEKGAANLQKQMTQHTIKTARQLQSFLSVSLEIRYTDGNQALMQKWLGDNLNYQPQVAGDLGKKMHMAAVEAFATGKQRIVMIGIDCPDLTTHILKTAFSHLKSHDLVLGKAKDGGYYLIGFNRLIPQIWQDISWGSSQVFAQTVAKIKHLGIKASYLKELNDIDRPEDLIIWQKHHNQ